MKQIGWGGQSSNYLLDKSIDPRSQTQSPEDKPGWGSGQDVDSGLSIPLETHPYVCN
jgi:hypothetical protein